MPNVVLEAMAESCPVVSTPVGDVPYLIEHGRNGFLVKHDDPQGLAAEIKKLLVEPKLAEKIGSAGRVTVEKHFSPTQMAHTLEEIYKDLLIERRLLGRENDRVQQL
jgi:glycosyltransferase involved in cell wall biosynthesis